MAEGSEFLRTLALSASRVDAAAARVGGLVIISKEEWDGGRLLSLLLSDSTGFHSTHSQHDPARCAAYLMFLHRSSPICASRPYRT